MKYRFLHDSRLPKVESELSDADDFFGANADPPL